MDPAFPIAALDAIDLVSGTLAQLERLAITGPALLRHRRLAAAPAGRAPTSCRCPSTPASRPRPGRWPASSSGAGGWPGGRCPPTGRWAPPSTGCGASSRRVWCELVTSGGCDPARLRTQAMITPACGLYRHGVTQAEQVLDVHQPAGRTPARPGHRRPPLGRRVTDWRSGRRASLRPLRHPGVVGRAAPLRYAAWASAERPGASQPFGRVTAVSPVPSRSRSGPGRRSGRTGRRAAPRHPPPQPALLRARRPRDPRRRVGRAHARAAGPRGAVPRADHARLAHPGRSAGRPRPPSPPWCTPCP